MPIIITLNSSTSEENGDAATGTILKTDICQSYYLSDRKTDLFMELKTIIENYLSVISVPSEDHQDKIRALMISLDQLASFFNQIEYIFDQCDYPEAPDMDYASLYQTVEKNFPTLGNYNIASEFAGDAIDDIVDIACDLKDVLWRYDHTSKDDALFHMQLGFQSHWGRHLRLLQLYLHSLHW